jgi:hypothetical protein
MLFDRMDLFPFMGQYPGSVELLTQNKRTARTLYLSNFLLNLTYLRNIHHTAMGLSLIDSAR